MNSFAHLHVHSEYSLLDGLSRIKHLAARAKELNMPALALTDHGAMHGAIDFYRACRKAGVKPILGMESYLAARTMIDKDADKDRERFHLLLLAQNQTGYQNLLKIASVSQLEGYYYRPRIDREFLARHSEGLITTTGCMAGEIPRAIQAGNVKKADALLAFYLETFGRDRFFIELQEHSIPELTAVNKTLVEMGGRYDVRFLATNDVHYTYAHEANPHDVLLCIQTGKTVDTGARMRMSDQGYYLKSYDEMFSLFGDIPGALENSLLIAEMCDVNPEPEGYHLPLFDVPEGFTPHSYLRHLCEKGLAWRYGAERASADTTLHNRLEHELKVINSMGFDTYFLIVWDLCEFARHSDIWWNVRGSGAGSLVAYSLGITGIDPLAHDLIFERFLNPGRVSMPDIDLDYPDDRRHEMIEYTIRKYGSDKVAQIITFGTMGARAAIRDVGRALDVPLAEVDAIARLIPAIPGKPVTIGNVLDPEHEFYSAELAQLVRQNEQVHKLVDTARGLEGVARHASTHAAGVIITDRPIVEYAPLHRPTSNHNGEEGVGVVTQWPMEILESMGLLKVDFLGLSTLTVLRQAAKLIEERRGVRYTMENIPYDQGQVGPDPGRDPSKLFALLGRGEVAGVFQVEGQGMRRLMVDMKPQRFDHIVAAISLYRPGPMENIPEYIARMHGKNPVQYHHADLEPILGDTYGILIFQEQIIRIASELAGYAPGEADMIRKAVGKKIRALIDKHRTLFIDGAMNRGYSRQVCEAIWGDIEYFARYGFNKCLPGDVQIVDAASGRLVSIGALYNGESQVSQIVSCDTGRLKLEVSEITAVTDNGVKPVYRLTTSLGREIEATANHPFYTFDGWRWLQDLQPGDLIAVPRCLPVQGHTEWPDHQVIVLGDLLAAGNLCRPHQEIPAAAFTLGNRQIALLLGRMWAGDGTVAQQAPGSVHAYYATSSRRVAAQMQHLLLRLGIVSSRREAEFSYKGERSGYQVRVMGGEHIRRFAQIIGPHLLTNKHQELCTWLIERPFRENSAKERVPLPVAAVVHQEKEMAGVTWPELRAESGIAPGEFRPRATAAKKGFQPATINRVADYFQSDGLRRYAQSDIYWDEITAVEYVGEKRTYDLTIAGTHNFIANDILVHNSHAADYAVITCQTAFLKAHYPVEYVTALLSVERDNSVKVGQYLAESRRLGITVAPPDVNLSDLDFTIEGSDEQPIIRYGLGAIKNAGTAAMELILQERAANGRFQDLADLCERVDLRRVGKRALESMVKVGVFDQWGSRLQLLDALDRMMAHSSNTLDAAAAGQMSLFGLLADTAASIQVELLRPEAALAAVDYREVLSWEKELIGVYLSEHPLSRYVETLQNGITATTTDLLEMATGRGVTIVGLITSLRTLSTKKGEPMAFGNLEDLHGNVELVFFPRTWAEYRDQVKLDQVLLVRGKVQIAENGNEAQAKILVDGVDTNLTLATAAGDDSYYAPPATAYLLADDPVEEAFDPAADEMQLMPAAGAALAAPAAESFSGKASLATPPPANFDDDPGSWPAGAMPAPVRTRAAGNDDSGSAAAAAALAEPQLATGAVPVVARLVRIEIRPAQGWQDAVRRVLAVANGFPGTDRLSVFVGDQRMDFPDRATSAGPELLAALAGLPGVLRVETGEWDTGETR